MLNRSVDVASAAAARAARARELATAASPAADLLRFYCAVIERQEQSTEQWDGDADPPPAYVASGFSRTSGSLLQAIDPAWVGGATCDFVRWLVRLPFDFAQGPAGLHASFEDLHEATTEEWREIFESYRADPDDAAARFNETAVFVLEAVLQPVAERLAAARQDESVRGVRLPAESVRGVRLPAESVRGVRLQPDQGSGEPTRPRCPACGGAPVVGVLREEGHGARRRLVCGLCSTEWDYLRVVCVKCGEQRFESLPVFSAEQLPCAHVDACDTCRSYLKTIDATKDGRVVPVVDDLATVALDLWAREQGYTRIRASLIGI
jgi:formate dehydrogenase maturation protein FdhE